MCLNIKLNKYTIVKLMSFYYIFLIYLYISFTFIIICPSKICMWLMKFHTLSAIKHLKANFLKLGDLGTRCYQMGVRGQILSVSGSLT